MSTTQTAQQTVQPTLTLVPTTPQTNIEILHKAILSEAEIVQRLIQCGDCD